MSGIQERAWKEREKRMAERKILWEKATNTEKELDAITVEMKDKICLIVDDVERRVIYL